MGERCERTVKNMFLGLGIFISVYSLSTAKELTLEDVLREVKTSNREVKIQELTIRDRGYEVNKDTKVFLPTVEIESTKELVGDDPWNRNEWSREKGSTVERLNVDLSIFNGFRDTNNLRKSMLEKEISLLEDNLVKYDTEERAIFEYFEILNNRTQTGISDQVIKNLEDQKERLNGLYENGQMIPKSELLKVEADIVAEEAVRERRVQQQRSAEETLNLLMGTYLDTKYTYADYTAEKISADEYDIQKDSQTALTRGSKARREKLLLEDADLDVKLAKSDLFPEVFGTYTYRFQKEDEDDISDYQASITARWEIFSWGSTIDDINQKKVRKEQAELNYTNRMDEITLELRNAHRELMTLQKEVESQELRLELLRENLEIDSLRYQNGFIESIDYLSSVNDLSETAATYYTLVREFILRQREYENLLK